MLGKNVTMGKISKTKLTELPTRLLGRVLVALMILMVCMFLFVVTVPLSVLANTSSLNIVNLTSTEFQISPKFNMSYIHYNDKASYVKYVENTNGSISEVAPNYFSLSKKGNLILSSTIDKEFIDEMHSRGIKVVPYLSNDWDRTSGRLAISKRHKLTNEIIEIIEKYNLDGINIDIEDLTEKDRDRYVEFVKMLRRRLPDDKTVAVAVAANPRGITTGWHGSYDYEELGKYSDYLMVMAYDEHYGGGAPGPVASIDFVENSIKYALKKVPKEKIVLGIPFYGRMWRSGGGMSGQGISLRFAEGLIAKYGGSVSFSSKYLSPKAIITIKSEHEKPIINGSKMRPGTYTIWYENERSLKHKLSLVKKYGLKGAGSWSLGQETSSVWNYYSLWLNGHCYSDCQGHGAQNPIIFALNNEWMTTKTVKDSSGFAPDRPLTRAEAAVAIVRALQLEKNMVYRQDEVVFKDISSHWAKKEIEIAVQHRIVMGKGNGLFAPDEAVTREEMSVMLDRALKSSRELAVNSSRSGNSNEITKDNSDVAINNGDSELTDVNDEIFNKNVNIEAAYVDVSREMCVWSYESIVRMTRQGIFAGSPDGRFKPNEKISRAEMAALLYRILRN